MSKAYQWRKPRITLIDSIYTFAVRGVLLIQVFKHLVIAYTQCPPHTDTHNKNIFSRWLQVAIQPSSTDIYMCLTIKSTCTRGGQNRQNSLHIRHYITSYELPDATSTPDVFVAAEADVVLPTSSSPRSWMLCCSRNSCNSRPFDSNCCLSVSSTLPS